METSKFSTSSVPTSGAPEGHKTGRALQNKVPISAGPEMAIKARGPWKTKKQGGNITFLLHLSPTQLQSSSLSQSAWLSQVTGAPYPEDNHIPHTGKKNKIKFCCPRNKWKSSWSDFSGLEKAWRSNIPSPSFTPRARILPNKKSKGRKGNKRIFNVIKCVMCLKSILLCHIPVYIDRFVCVFSFLPVSRTTTAILLSHNCFLAPSTHSSTAASQIHYRKDLLPQLM